MPAVDWSRVDIAVPRPAARRPGVSMAGFAARDAGDWDIAMVAHPSVTLLIDLSEEGLVCDRAGRGERGERGSVVIGLLPGAVRTSGWRTGDCLQVRLHPAVAAAAFGASADLTGAVVPFDQVWGRDAERFVDRLREAGSWDARFAIAGDLLRSRVPTRRRVDPEVAHIWRRALTSHGQVRVDGLAEEVGWSRKRLWSRFRAQLGITPKRAAQLVRFDHAAHLLAAGQGVASVAADSGYVDQSHLHREVMAFAGLTPTGVAAAPWLAIDDIAWPTRP